MESLLQQLSRCIESGRLNKDSKYPPDLLGTDGTEELTRKALELKIPPGDILKDALMAGMKRVGEKFRDGKIFLPEVLIAAKAMKNSMEILKPYFQSGEIKLKGKVILGTVSGDLHDIGKNIVKMVLEGGGWEVIDLGVNVNSQKFCRAVSENQVRVVGLSALLTTTMMNMESTVRDLKNEFPDICVVIGGAPLSQSYADSINADKYFQGPQGMLEYLNSTFDS